ncbi:MAG TPA: secretin N-terminal domain-containing protein [Gallionellaceae bacterium]
MSHINAIGKLFLAAAATSLLASCASHVKRGDEFAEKDEWTQAVLEYRQASREESNDIEIRSHLKQIELKAAEYYYHRGVLALGKGDLDGAIGQFQQGLVAMPENDKLQAALKKAELHKEARTLYQEGVSLLGAGKTEDAKRRFHAALQANPDLKEAAAQLAALEKQENAAKGSNLALNSSAPITLSFRETDIRDAYEFLTKSFGVNVIFDDGVKNVPVTLFAKDVTFEQGLSLLLATSKTFYRKIGPNTILVALDNKEKRGQYEDQIVRTFELNTVRAKDMADIIKGVLTVKKIVVNEQLNTLTARDSEDVIRLVDRMVQNNDKKQAEVVLDVEILEINRTKSENLGLDFGSYQVSAAIPPYPLTTSYGDALSSGTLTLPSATLHFFKQDVDAKTLANPRIRVLNGKSAKIHIGDRVPLIATTIQDATGQVRNTYDYKELGIRLTAEPLVHLDNSVTVKLGMEVSSLGQNLGSPSQPAYSIGSRDAETSMLLRDGETAILGGLIQDSERNAKVTIPGIGDVPALGSLFSNYNNSKNRTDVLLTITPHVVRGWEVPSVADRQFYSGTENAYADRQLFAELKNGAVNDAGAAVTPKITNSGSGPTVPAPAADQTPAATPPAVPVVAAPAAANEPRLGFADTVYDVAAGKDFTVKLTGQNLGEATALPLELLYNAQVISLVQGEAGDVKPQSFAANADADKGILSVQLSYPPNAAPKDNAVIANLHMHANNAGVSYLIYRTRTLTGPNGETINAQIQAARVVVK